MSWLLVAAVVCRLLLLSLDLLLAVMMVLLSVLLLLLMDVLLLLSSSCLVRCDGHIFGGLRNGGKRSRDRKVVLVRLTVRFW